MSSYFSFFYSTCIILLNNTSYLHYKMKWDIFYLTSVNPIILCTILYVIFKTKSYINYRRIYVFIGIQLKIIRAHTYVLDVMWKNIIFNLNLIKLITESFCSSFMVFLMDTFRYRIQVYHLTNSSEILTDDCSIYIIFMV